MRRHLMIFLLLLFFFYSLFTTYKLHKDYDYKESTNEVDISPFLLQHFRSQAPLRRQTFREILEKNITDYLTFYNALVPEVYCAERVRLGTIGDGGKWICSPQRLPSGCAIVSLGLNNMISFEEEIQLISKKKCRLFGYDSEKQSERTIQRLKVSRGKVVQALIGDGSFGSVQLSDILNKESITEVEILKMDIEGTEWFTLLPFLEKHNVSQVLVELHHQGGASNKVQLLNQMSKLGYQIFSSEINGRYHELVELSLIHSSQLENYRAISIAQYLNF